MYHYQYATKREKAPLKREIEGIIHAVQDDVRGYFTFSYRFSGSETLNLVTYDPTTNTGFDFDINIEVNDDDDEFEPTEIKHILMDSFSKFARGHGYDFSEDNTRVFTIKKKDKAHSRIIFSCDFAIVNDYEDEEGYLRQEIIIHDKKRNAYHWDEQSDGHYLFERRVSIIKEEGHWAEVRELYLNKKNTQEEESRVLRSQTINDIWQKYGLS